MEPVIEKVGVIVCQDFLEKNVRNVTKDMKISPNVPLLVKKSTVCATQGAQSQSVHQKRALGANAFRRNIREDTVISVLMVELISLLAKSRVHRSKIPIFFSIMIWMKSGVNRKFSIMVVIRKIFEFFAKPIQDCVAL